MTAQIPEAAPVQVKAGAGSRLEQLQATFRETKAALSAAEAAHKAIVDAIKGELDAMRPEGVTRIDLVGAVPLRMAWVESWRFDSKKLKTDDPVTYVRYAKKSGYWTLGEAKGGEG